MKTFIACLPDEFVPVPPSPARLSAGLSFFGGEAGAGSLCRRADLNFPLSRIHQDGQRTGVGPSSSRRGQARVSWVTESSVSRRCGGVDDGGWSAFSPLGDDFIMSPGGSVAGESTELSLHFDLTLREPGPAACTNTMRFAYRSHLSRNLVDVGGVEGYWAYFPYTLI